MHTRPVIAPSALLALAIPVLLVAAGSAALAGGFFLKARRIRRELDVSEARQRSILEGAGEAVIVIDHQACITLLNPAAERMFGYSAAELTGLSLETLMTHGARQAHAAYLLQHGETAMVQAVRLRSVHKGVRKSGEVFPFELTMTEWRDGQQRMFTGVMRDVSERERAALALRESQARYSGLYENSAELLFIYKVGGDGDFTLESMNRTAEIYTGRPRSVVVGRTSDAFASPRQARALKRALLQCVELRGSVLHEVQLRIDGERRRLHLTLSPLPDAAGEITHILARARDHAVGAPVESEVRAALEAAA